MPSSPNTPVCRPLHRGDVLRHHPSCSRMHGRMSLSHLAMVRYVREAATPAIPLPRDSTRDSGLINFTAVPAPVSL